MTRLAEIEGHIGSMSGLLDIVGAMRSLAGIRIQEAQRSLPGTRRYADAVASALADTLLLMKGPAPRTAPPQERRALVLCTAEHGFVGGFNERLLDAAEATLEPGGTLFVLGTRGAAMAFERRRPAGWTHPMATRCAAAPETVQRLSAELYRRIAGNEITRVEVIYARSHQAGPATLERSLLLPLDLVALGARQPRQPPLHNMDPIALHEKLLAEYVFARLTEAAVESIASENAARFSAMESAHESISRKLDALRCDARQVRQSEITTEIVELVTATNAQVTP